MGYLKQVESLVDPAKPPYVFAKAVPTGNLGIQRRDAIFTIANVDYGGSPFGGNPAPLAPVDWSWGARILTHRQPDVARDALNAAIGTEAEYRLVWAHDGGYERVVTARLKSIDWPRHVDDTYYVDAKVNWTILEPWHERAPATGIIAGIQPPIIAGQTPTVTAGDQTYALTSTGLPVAFTLPLTIANASGPGPGGVPNYRDTAPIITVTGPYGGDFGFIIYNYAERLLNRDGTLINPFIGVEMKVPAGKTCSIDCGAQRATIEGFGDVTDLIYKPDIQPYWFIIKPGVANGIAIQCSGANATTGGTIQLRWMRKWL